MERGTMVRLTGPNDKVAGWGEECVFLGYDFNGGTNTKSHSSQSSTGYSFRRSVLIPVELNEQPYSPIELTDQDVEFMEGLFDYLPVEQLLFNFK